MLQENGDCEIYILFSKNSWKLLTKCTSSLMFCSKYLWPSLYFKSRAYHPTVSLLNSLQEIPSVLHSALSSAPPSSKYLTIIVRFSKYWTVLSTPLIPFFQLFSFFVVFLLHWYVFSQLTEFLVPSLTFPPLLHPSLWAILPYKMPLSRHMSKPAFKSFPSSKCPRMPSPNSSQ